MRKISYVVDESFDGRAAGVFLRRGHGISARLLTKLRHTENGILLGGVPIRTIDPVRAGDVVEIMIPDKVPDYEQGGEMPEIIYEDEDVLVLNKPAGLAMHPTHNHQGDTLANAVTGYLRAKGSDPTVRAVGRLDKQTSGAVVLALNKLSAAALVGKVEKTYLALVCGIPDEEGEFDLPIIRPDPMKTLRSVGEDGLPALTRYRVLATDGTVSLCEVRPVTGRTHQIRVHFSSAGFPLLGDDMYGASDLTRHYPLVARAALHCSRVCFTSPVNGRELSLTAPMPEDFEGTVRQISGGKA
ncbi:MAG: RluA family pseudouridine synthase [Clostridia bacterium]|nr:RluA family pseudouridine synthase [Clostridia bacterium]